MRRPQRNAGVNAKVPKPGGWEDSIGQTPGRGEYFLVRRPPSKRSGRAPRAPVRIHRPRPSVEASGRVGEHRIDLAGLRGEIGPRQHLAAILARHLLEQPLELADIAVDGALEIAVVPIALADFLERPLALHGVELAREHVALAALVTVP